jgi:hypothetical protein
MCSDLFAKILAFISYRHLHRKGLRIRIFRGTSKYQRSSATKTSTCAYSFVIASVISAFRTVREDSSCMSCSTAFRCSHIACVNSQSWCIVFRTHTIPLSLFAFRCQFAATAKPQYLLK